MFKQSLQPKQLVSYTATALVVEDDRFQAAAIEARLGRRDVGCHTVGTVSDAMAFISKYHIDFAIVDLGLPDGDGLDVVKAIRSSDLNKKIPVIIATANHSEKVTIEAYRDCGVMLVSHKPIEWSCLEYVLESTVLKDGN